MGTPAAFAVIRVGGSSEVEGYQPAAIGSARAPWVRPAPNPFCRCTHWKPSCFVMAAIAIEPPTVLGRAMENFTKPICRLHEKTRQIDRIADGHGFYEEKLEERGRELSMEVARCVRREPAAGGRVLKVGPQPKDQTT